MEASSNQMTPTVDREGSLPTPVPANQVQSRTPPNGRRIVGFVVILQSILFLAHWFVYQTWTVFRTGANPPGITKLQATLFLLAITFVAASLLDHRHSNALVRLFYRMAATWLGVFNFLFVAACLCWVVYLGCRLFGLHLGRPVIVDTAFGWAILASMYGVVNAHWVRVKKIRVKLPNLPASWRGRVAALVSDVHLGPVNGFGFMQRIVAMLGRLRPDVVFITGDLYDGGKVDLAELVAPWKEFPVKFGTYFVTGNHEEFSDRKKYLEAVHRSGIRVLSNEKVILDGLQIVGVHYGDSANPDRFRTILKHADLDRNRASILLSHVPHQLSIAQKAGISLQLSGHTHGGQIFPFTWFTTRVFGEYTYGLKRFGHLLVYTSSGAGTWGPPMRVGTRPEIVLIEFE
jgi:predicted MPP superfamily phosphohydrolase